MINEIVNVDDDEEQYHTNIIHIGQWEKIRYIKRRVRHYYTHLHIIGCLGFMFSYFYLHCVTAETLAGNITQVYIVKVYVDGQSYAEYSEKGRHFVQDTNNHICPYGGVTP